MPACAKQGNFTAMGVRLYFSVLTGVFSNMQ